MPYILDMSKYMYMYTAIVCNIVYVDIEQVELRIARDEWHIVLVLRLLMLCAHIHGAPIHKIKSTPI